MGYQFRRSEGSTSHVALSVRALERLEQLRVMFTKLRGLITSVTPLTSSSLSGSYPAAHSSKN